jgi:hypothetical protein
LGITTDGILRRANAKICKELGIEKHEYYIYHKSHIEKVMAVAITGYASDGSPDNGGDGLKIGIYRVQVSRIAKKKPRIAKMEQRQSNRNAVGILRYDGPILRRKGDCYFVDLNVTGSVEGTSDKPKFALRSLFEKTVFPRISELVKSGGEYAGYVPVIQGDNAGPHQNGDFVWFCKTYCVDNGWH